jgi:hypothetical protein
MVDAHRRAALGDDARPARLDAEDLELFERTKPIHVGKSAAVDAPSAPPRVTTMA